MTLFELAKVLGDAIQMAIEPTDVCDWPYETFDDEGEEIVHHTRIYVDGVIDLIAVAQAIKDGRST